MKYVRHKVTTRNLLLEIKKIPMCKCSDDIGITIFCLTYVTRNKKGPLVASLNNAMFGKLLHKHCRCIVICKMVRDQLSTYLPFSQIFMYFWSSRFLINVELVRHSIVITYWRHTFFYRHREWYGNPQKKEMLIQIRGKFLKHYI